MSRTFCFALFLSLFVFSGCKSKQEKRIKIPVKATVTLSKTQITVAVHAKKGSSLLIYFANGVDKRLKAGSSGVTKVSFPLKKLRPGKQKVIVEIENNNYEELIFKKGRASFPVTIPEPAVGFALKGCLTKGSGHFEVQTRLGTAKFCALNDKLELILEFVGPVGGTIALGSQKVKTVGSKKVQLLLSASKWLQAWKIKHLTQGRVKVKRYDFGNSYQKQISFPVWKQTLQLNTPGKKADKTLELQIQNKKSQLSSIDWVLKLLRERKFQVDKSKASFGLFKTYKRLHWGKVQEDTPLSALRYLATYRDIRGRKVRTCRYRSRTKGLMKLPLFASHKEVEVLDLVTGKTTKRRFKGGRKCPRSTVVGGIFKKEVLAYPENWKIGRWLTKKFR